MIVLSSVRTAEPWTPLGVLGLLILASLLGWAIAVAVRRLYDDE